MLNAKHQYIINKNKLVYLQNMKKIVLLISILLFSGLLKAQDYPYQDKSLDVNVRVEDLLSRLTLDEKMAMLEHRNPAIPSLGLPAYSWWNEALHGVARNGYATVWPMPVALAASFNTEMVWNLFSEVAIEANVKYRDARTSDTCVALREPTDYTGLTFFTPNINIFRDPRWGRGMETYGEDPFLTATMGLACVRGLQHAYDRSWEQPKIQSAKDGKFATCRMPGNSFYGINTPLTAAACIKHLAVHSGPEGVRHEFDSRVSPRDMWTTYLPAFEYIINNSDVQQVMCGYNRINGEPCCTNKELLIDILRNKWHYDGLLVTDCWALNDCWERDTVIPRHKTHPTAAAAAADAFGYEVDLECGSGLEALRVAVDSGYIAENKINEHVRRVLRTRLRAEMDDDRDVPECSVDPARACAESLVLLKNEGDLLPLKPQTKIYLAGPNSDDTLMPQGNYNGTPRHTVSIREGLSRYFTLVNTPAEAQVVVYAGGINPQLEGEELPVELPGFHKGDRTLIELPADQRKALRKLQRKHRPVVLLLCSGSSFALDKNSLGCDAIMECWYGGEAMGEGVAASMAGKYDCFGRLPLTFYRSTLQMPAFENYAMQGRTYRYMDDNEPLFPFGYGLNYANARLKRPRMDYESMTIRGQVECLSRPCGDAPATTVVKVYMSNPNDPKGPKKSLVGYQKVELKGVGESTSFEIKIDPFWLRQFDEESQEMVAPKDVTKLRFSVTL